MLVDLAVLVVSVGVGVAEIVSRQQIGHRFQDTMVGAHDVDCDVDVVDFADVVTP
ncbi:hypothetical protein D3C85_1601530 [compost metagenome]